MDRALQHLKLIFRSPTSRRPLLKYENIDDENRRIRELRDFRLKGLAMAAPAR
jgi:hypothetical protein